MPRIRLAAPFLALLMVAACANIQDQIDEIAGDDDNDDGPRTVAFECDDNREFQARFSGDRDEVRVNTGGSSYDLEYSDRDDGMRVYTNDDDIELRVSDRDAYLRVPGESDFEDCEMS
jgi:hypothetical protein